MLCSWRFRSSCHACLCDGVLLTVHFEISVYYYYRQDAAKRQTAGIKFTHRPKIRFFAPQGRLIAPIHIKLGRADGHVSPLGCAKFHVNRHRVGMLPSKYQKFSLFGRLPWPILKMFMSFYTPNYLTLVFQISCDSHHGFQSTHTLTKSYHANSYPSQLVPNTNSYPDQLVPNKLVSWPTRTYYQLVPKPCRTQYQLVPNFTMYITKRSTYPCKRKKWKLILLTHVKKYMPQMQWQMSKF